MLQIFEDNTLPVVTDTITVDGAPVNLTGATAKFRMRQSASSILKVDAIAAIAGDPTTGGISYSWAAGDTDTPALYRGWWHITFPGAKIQDTPEFDIEVIQHASTAGDLCTVEDVRMAMELPTVSTDTDGLIADLITQASSQITRHTGRQFVQEGTLQTPVTKLFVTKGSKNRIDLYPYDLQTLVGTDAVILNPASMNRILSSTNSDYDLRPHVHWADDPCYTSIVISPWLSITDTEYMKFGHAHVQVTGIWGFPSVPVDVKRAAIIAVRSWLRRDQSQYSNFVPTNDTDLIPKPVGTYALPYASCDLLRPFKRWHGSL